MKVSKMLVGNWQTCTGLAFRRKKRRKRSQMMALPERFTCNYFIKEGGFFYFPVIYTTLLHLPPLRFHSVEG
jgi:hypothetical protein